MLENQNIFRIQKEKYDLKKHLSIRETIISIGEKIFLQYFVLKGMKFISLVDADLKGKFY